MSNNNFLLEPKYEFFELVLNVDDSRISSTELRGYLLQLEKLVNSVNQTLNDNIMGGFDSVSIDVLALECGSFKLPLSLKKIINPKNFNILKNLTDNSTVGTIIGGVIVALLMNGFPNTMDYEGPETYGIPTEVYLENINTAKAVKSIAKLVIDNDSIHDLSVTFEGRESKRQKIIISKESLIETKEHMEAIIDNNEMPNFLEEETLQIISPALGDGPDVFWKFRFQGKMIEAEMRDRNYMHRVRSGNIVFHYGDEIIADMMYEGRGKNRKYYIFHVYDY